MFTHAGFGAPPPVPFPGAVPGKLRPAKSWRPIEQATMSYGYGLSVSLFQLARAYSVFARDGDLVPVTFLKADGPVAGQRVFSAETARQVRSMLEAAAAPGGTAPRRVAEALAVGRERLAQQPVLPVPDLDPATFPTTLS